MSMAELLERIRDEWARLEASFAELSAEQMTARPMEGGWAGWSVKDQLAHVALWEELALGRVEGRSNREHELFGMDEATAESADLDTFNAAVYERNKDTLLDDVLAAFRSTHERLMLALERLPEANLAKPFAPDDPQQRSVLQTVANNTYTHYPEHTAAIQAPRGG
jgi:hypothetical protein